MAALGVLGFTATQVFQAIGTGLTSGSAATVLASTSPLFIAIIAPLVLHEYLRPIGLVGIVVALVGVGTITSAGLDSGPVLAGSWIGNVLVLLSSLASACNTVLGKPVYLRYSPLLFCGVGCIGGAVASLPFAIWELSTQPLPAPGPAGWALVLYLAVLVTFVGFVVWFWGLRALPAARAGALMFLQPLFGLVLAMALLGDRPSPVFLAGCLLVVAGVYLAASRAGQSSA
jgi:drug/metabolite transporter (DMT)-like permease